MAFDSAQVLQAIKALAESIPAVGSVSIGQPENLPRRVTAWVELGPQPVVDRTTGGLMQRDGEYLLVIAYRVKGAEANAELDLAATLDELTRAFYADRTLGGVGTNGSLDFGLAGTGDYQPIVGQEWRIYPVLVRISQRDTLTV
jgi:hypothetical protein